MGKDFEKIPYSNDDSSDEIYDISKGDTNNDNKNDKDIAQSEKEDRQSSFDEEENSFEKEKSSFEQKENGGEKDKNSGKEGQESFEGVSGSSNAYATRQTYSASYYPPSSYSKSKKRKEKRCFSGGFLVAVVSVCVVLSLVCGAFSGFVVSRMLDGDGEPNTTYAPPSEQTDAPSINDDTVTIDKNNAPTKVDQIIDDEPEDTMTTVEVVESVAASVVEVSTLTTSNYGQYVSGGAGSGVIIAQGNGYAYIVTNYHVIDGSDYIAVRLTDKSEYEAEYIDGDEYDDIAMLRIKETKELCVAKIGSSDTLRIGEGVVAIGNPLGELGGTVTDGIVSALDREITIGGVTMTLLQTNAAVNPGNSGGGLFNMAGRLVGIVNAKHQESGIEGLGFAIPIDHVYEDLLEIIEDGYIHGRVNVGIEAIYLDRMSALYYFGSRKEGVYIIGSDVDSLQVGDRIVSVGTNAISNEADYINAISSLEIGSEVVINIVRGNDTSNVTVTVKEYIPDSILVKE